jgi:predicted MFS family arabinose efflux permease
MQTQRSLFYSWWLWFVAALFFALDYFQHTAPSVLIKPIAQAAHLSVFDIGSIMSVYFPVYALAQLPAGYLLDKFGVRFVLTITCLIVSLGLYLMSIPHESTLLDGRILIAAGSAFAFLGALKTASSTLPPKIFPIAVGMTNSIGVLGGILGLPFLNYLIMKYNWVSAVHMIALFGVGLALFLLIFLRLPKSSIQQEQRSDKRVLHVFRDRNIWFLAIYAGIMVGAVVNAFSELYDVTFLESAVHITSQKAAEISSMIFIGIGVGGPLHGFIARFFKSEKTWMLIACLMTVVAFSGIIISATNHFPPAALYVLYFATGFFVSSMLLSFDVAKQAYDKSVHATIFALVNMTISFGGFVFQYLLSHLLKNAFGYQASFIFLLVPLAFSFILCLAFKSRQLPAQKFA